MCILNILHVFIIMTVLLKHFITEVILSASGYFCCLQQNDGLSDSRDDLDCVALNKVSSVSVPGLLDLEFLGHRGLGGSQQGLQMESSHQGLLQGLLMEPHQLSGGQRALSTSCLDLTNSNGHLQSQNDIDKLR